MKKEELISLIAKLPQSEQAKMLDLLEAYEDQELLKKARSSFLAFTQYTWDGFIAGAHHATMAKAFDRVVDGSSKRLIINLPPRHSKSELASIRLPAYFLGHYPDKKIIAASHTADLAVNFGRKVRDFMQGEEYQSVFPETKVRSDAKAAGKWATTAGGEYYAVGVGGALAGRGADLCLDPSSVVMVRSGPTPIGSVEEGQEILSPIGWDRISRKKLTTHTECVRINSVKCSTNHPFLCERGWVEAGSITRNDKILTITVWKKIWIGAGSLLRTLLSRLGRV